MKKLLFFLLLASVPAFAQIAPTSENSQVAPFKEANAVLVQTADSGRVALVKLANLLQGRGIIVERIDYTLLSLYTKTAPVPGAVYPADMTLLATATAVTNSRLTLSGQTSTVVLNQKVNLPAAIKGGERGAGLLAFRLMQQTAEAYPGGKVSYTKRP